MTGALQETAEAVCAGASQIDKCRLLHKGTCAEVADFLSDASYTGARRGFVLPALLSLNSETATVLFGSPERARLFARVHSMRLSQASRKELVGVVMKLRLGGDFNKRSV